MIEVVGYSLALVDLFDQTSRVEAWLIKLRELLQTIARRFPLKSILFLYMFFGILFKNYIEIAVGDLGALHGASALTIVILVLLSLPLYFILLLVLAHVLAWIFAIFARHPKGILGAVGLVLTAFPGIWSML